MTPSNTQQPNLVVRVTAGLILLVLVVAFIALYLNPRHTETNFSWTIKPDTTAILMGCGYMAGAYFFARVAAAKKWQYVASGFLPITVFTLLMLAATLLHWDRFHQGSFIFFFWTFVYALTPILVPLLWWLNRRRDPGTLDEKDVRIPLPIRIGLGAFGAVALLVGILGFIYPTLLIDLAPWNLTALTARIEAGWGALASSVLIAWARDGRWSAIRVMLQSFIFGQLLALVALPRIWGDLDFAKPAAYAFVGGLVAALVILIAAHIVLSRLTRGT